MSSAATDLKRSEAGASDAPPLRSIFLSHVALRFFDEYESTPLTLGESLDDLCQLFALVRSREPDALCDAFHSGANTADSDPDIRPQEVLCELLDL